MDRNTNYWRLFAVQAAALGTDSQKRLRRACVAVVGAGGVGTSAILSLAAAGIGRVTVIDPQVVAPGNFNRMGFTTRTDIGRPKVEVLRRLLKRRPNLMIEVLFGRAEDPAATRVYEQADLIVTASNTIQSRIATTRYAVLNGRMHVAAGVADVRQGLMGIITAWRPDRPDLACHACFLRDEVRTQDDVLLGSVTAFAGVLAAHMAVLLLGTGRPSPDSADTNLVTFDLMRLGMEALSVKPRPGCSVCGPVSANTHRSDSSGK